MDRQVDVAVVGAGIVGVAHALAASRRGHSVCIFERNDRAKGASVRNFGAVWTVGMAPGKIHARAMLSRNIWLDLAETTGLWHEKTGALFPVYRQDEVAVVEEFASLGPEQGYNCELLNPRARPAPQSCC